MFRPGDDGAWESVVVSVAPERIRMSALAVEGVVDDWSADGQAFAVTDNNAGRVFLHPRGDTYPRRQIDVVVPDQSERTRVTADPDSDNIFARFSPDGAAIVHYQRRYQSDGTTVGTKVFEGFVVSKLDGSEPTPILWAHQLDEELRRIDNYPAYPWYWSPHGPPCWSPDGSQVAVCFANKKHPSSEERMRFGLLIVSADGQVDRAIDLNEIGITWVNQIDWK
jgi:hypothetical protein